MTLTSIVGLASGDKRELRHRVFHDMGVDRFAFCFPPGRHGEGMIVWNDEDPHMDKNFAEIEMGGDTHWGFKMEKLRLEGSDGNGIVVGCEPSCGVMLDTGTSLISFDKPTTAAMKNAWNKLNSCKDVASLPSIKFELSGVTHELPYEDFIVVTMDDDAAATTPATVAARQTDTKKLDIGDDIDDEHPLFLQMEQAMAESRSSGVEVSRSNMKCELNIGNP